MDGVVDSEFAIASRATFPGFPEPVTIDFSAPIGYFEHDGQLFSETPFPDMPLMQVEGSPASFWVSPGGYEEGQAAVYALSNPAANAYRFGIEPTGNSETSTSDFVELNLILRETATGEAALYYGSATGGEGVGEFWRSDYTIPIPPGFEVVGIVAGGDSTGSDATYKVASGITTGYILGGLSATPGSVAEGSSTRATGSESHAEGESTTASGDHAHAEGMWSVASGNGAHSEGFESTASGSYAHTEGFRTVAAGYYVHAEGGYSNASGDASHAEGQRTKATGRFAHSEGIGAHASGDYSHAEGFYANAHRPGSHAAGSVGAVGTYAFLYPNATDPLRVQYLRYERFVETTSATSAALPLASAALDAGPDGGVNAPTAPYPADRRLAITFQIEVSALRLDGTAEAKAFTVRGGMLWNANVATLLGTPTVESFGTVPWTIAVTATSRGPVLTCTGEAAKNIRWNATFHLTENPLPLT